MLAAPDTIRFGHFRLDAYKRVLFAGDVAVPLSGRAFDLLALLVARPGEVLGRDDIVPQVWPGRTVSENNLTVQMSNLRQELKRHGGDGLIVTVQGRGYRFVGEVETAEPDKPPLLVNRLLREISRWRRSVALGCFFLVIIAAMTAGLTWRPDPAAPRLSIAVLPFRNLSRDHTQDYLVDKLTDDLTTDLAHLPSSTVIARKSTEVYRGQMTTAEKIGRALNVRYLVDGSLNSQDGRFEIDIQLLDATNGRHLWTSRPAPFVGRISEVRETIVDRLATALDFQLEQIESARSFESRPDDPDALDLFLRARAVLDRNISLSGLDKAQAWLERAVALQPAFGDALAELGAMLLTKVHDVDDPTPERDYGEAREMIRRALDVAPQNSRALAAQGRALTLENRWAEAIDNAEAALRIEPSNVEAEAVLARCAQAQGKLDEAVQHIETILRLVPDSSLNSSRYLTLGLIKLVEGKIDEGMQSLHKAIADDPDAVPTDGMGRVEVTNLLLIAGTELLKQSEAARAMYQEYNRHWRNRTVWRFAELFDQSYSQRPGFRVLMKALRQAGMPLWADEHASSPISKPACPGTEFDETPARLDNGDTLTTEDVAVQLDRKPLPLLLDVGRGVAKPPHTIVLHVGKVVETPQAFVLRVAQEVGDHSLTMPIIVMGDGTYGCNGYVAAKHLVAHGYRNVAWYRGGEEAWASEHKDPLLIGDHDE